MEVKRDIFSRLKKLFSTDVIIRNIGGNTLKVMDVDRVQSFGNVMTNSLVDKFTRIHRGLGMTPTVNPFQPYQTQRSSLYTDYEAMDTEPILASALDIIADECTLKNEHGEVLQIKTDDEKIQNILYNLFYDILNIEFNLWSWIRTMTKYGDCYLFLEIADKNGIYNVTPFTAYEISRIEGTNEKDPFEYYFIYDPNSLASTNIYYNTHNSGRDNNVVKFESYEMAHFRLLTDSNFLPYGRSFIEPARKVYKQYALAKDAMLIHRIMRAPEKRVFYTDVGSIPPHMVDAKMEDLANKMKKTPIIDPQTGEYNLRYNMQNILEDFYIPVRGNNSSTKIDTLKGLEYNSIEDINFLRDEMLSALKIPKAFFGFEKDLQGKATLAAEDIRFARTIERIQKIVVSELNKIALIHLYTQGFDAESLTNFELSLTSPSTVYEQEKVALWKEKIDLAERIKESSMLSMDWIYTNIFNMNESDYLEQRNMMIYDKQYQFRLDQISTEGNDPAITGVSYGTKHDLASLYGKSRGENEKVPDGYDEKNPVGPPTKKVSIFGKQDSNFGKDPLGYMEYRDTKAVDHSPLKVQYKGRGPLSLKEKNMLDNISTGKKIILFEDKINMLDENNIKKQKE